MTPDSLPLDTQPSPTPVRQTSHNAVLKEAAAQRLYLVSLEGVETEISESALRQAVTSGKLPPETEVKRGEQEFSYSAAMFLGLVPAKPLVFMCPACRSQVRSTIIDIQLHTVCPSCSASVVVPDRRPPAERQSSHSLQRSLRDANSQIVQGILLAGCAAGIAMLSPSDKMMGAILPVGLGIGGLYMILIGFRGRRNYQTELATKATVVED